MKMYSLFLLLPNYAMLARKLLRLGLCVSCFLCLATAAKGGGAKEEKKEEKASGSTTGSGSDDGQFRSRAVCDVAVA